jgi:methylenetetrahydrofolate reductase (NADPH)
VNSRFEVLPFGRAEEEAARLPEPVRLTVTASPSHTIDETVDMGKRLRSLGHDVTVHLAARMIRDREHLDALLGTMAEAGIDDAFVIGGDTTPHVGAFATAGQLLPLVREHAHRPARIGVAGYPEGHPLIADATLAEVLREKSRTADYMTTQLCFDPDVLLGWVRDIRASGIVLPVIFGVPGKVDRLRLLEIGTKVGVGPSLAFLKKQRGLRNLLRLSGSSADRLYDALAPHVGDRELGVEGFHWFTFNRLVETWTWEREKSA